LLTTGRNQEKPKKRDDTSMAVMVGSPGGGRFMARTEIVGASLFNQTRRWKTVKPQKAATPTLIFSGRAGRSLRGRKRGTNGEITASPSPPVRHPMVARTAARSNRALKPLTLATAGKNRNRSYTHSAKSA
jgi:hypothetical protein